MRKTLRFFNGCERRLPARPLAALVVSSQLKRNMLVRKDLVALVDHTWKLGMAPHHSSETSPGPRAVPYAVSTSTFSSIVRTPIQDVKECRVSWLNHAMKVEMED